MKKVWKLFVEGATIITGIGVLITLVGTAWRLLMQISPWAVALLIFSVLFVLFLSILIVVRIREHNENHKKINDFIDKPYETFDEWLIDKRNTGYPNMATESLEGRIVAMLNWWDERKKNEPEQNG